ncbi:MAG: hypothetical protein RL189_463 [Pseudomonadota bacterium]|jgi:signal transduction histidine kinase/DNA-binding response OmpR family regulator
MHKLLDRQLRKHFADRLDSVMADERFQMFCQSVDQAYSAHDDDRELLERSLELSSRELNEKNHDLQRAQYLAETANKAKSTFLANMSHEMRTPLNAIIGYSELILEEIEELSHEEISVELDKIRTSGNHLLGLINNVLDLAKIESGHMEVNWEQVDLGLLGKEVCTILQAIAVKNRNNLSCEICTENPAAITDRSKLKQILINLVGNALKFTHDGKVKICIADVDGDRIKVSIIDTGIGLSGDKLVKLFQPFVQAESDTQKKFGGTGLGLAISKKFSDLIESEIEVESQEGVGTSFHILIHRRPLSADVNTHKFVDRSEGTFVGLEKVDRRILVIDDDPSAIDLMRRFLGRHGFECISLKSGHHAVDEAIRLEPDAILLDVFMPDVDGWTILSRLKAEARTREIPVIFTTMTDERSLGLSLGAVDYFTKPIDWNRLAGVLSSFEVSRRNSVALLTEGDLTSSGSLIRQLEAAHWRVVLAGDTDQFIQYISKNTFDLVILDGSNSRLNSSDCLSALKDSPVNQQSAVLYFTDSHHDPDLPSVLRGRVKIMLTDNTGETHGNMLADILQFNPNRGKK